MQLHPTLDQANTAPTASPTAPHPTSAEGESALGRETDPELNLMTMPPRAAASETVHPFMFTGKASEYFRIWIVNTFLVIVSLGFWSPWAKIRKKKWFLGHTWVANANFDFHANPWPVFRGRLIAGAAFLIYWMAGEFNPQYATWVALVIAFAAPFLILGSLRFNLRNTSYRNIRFDSDAVVMNVVGAIWPLIIVAILGVLFHKNFNPMAPDLNWRSALFFLPTLVFSLFYPYLHGKLRLLTLDKSRYGTAPVRCTTRVKTFYSVYMRGSVVGVGLFLIAGVVAMGLGSALAFLLPKDAGFERIARLMSAVVTLPFAFAGLLWYAFTQTRLINATFNLTTIGDNVRLFSQIRTWPMGWMYFVNTLAVIFSLGLAIPWAAVRTAKQRVETTALAITGDLDAFAGSTIHNASAAADAATDFFSLDISL